MRDPASDSPTPGTPTADTDSVPTCPPIITQSTSQAITPLNSVSCNNGVGHTDNSYWRAFNMGTFAGGQQYNVTSVSFGVEEATGAGGTQPVTVRLYTTTNFPVGFPGSLTQIATTTIQVPDAASGTVLGVPLVATVPAGTSELVMELFTPDGQAAGNLFFVGLECGGGDRTELSERGGLRDNDADDTAAIGFPNMHIVFNVLGGCVPGATPTPSTTADRRQRRLRRHADSNSDGDADRPNTGSPPRQHQHRPRRTATRDTWAPLRPLKPINFSTRMFVQTGDSVGIGGFIIIGKRAQACDRPGHRTFLDP